MHADATAHQRFVRVDYMFETLTRRSHFMRISTLSQVFAVASVVFFSLESPGSENVLPEGKGKTEQPLVFDGLHCPTLGPLVAVSSPAMDEPFLDVLVEMKATTAAFFVQPSLYRAFASRYDRVVEMARSKGLKIRIVLQPEIQNMNLALGLPLSFSRPPTSEVFAKVEGEVVRLIARRLHPDYSTRSRRPRQRSSASAVGLPTTSGYRS